MDEYESAGDYARACHERIHLNLSKALGLKPVANVNNHHNFAWKEEIAPGRMAIVHRKGATPAQKGQAGLIPGSMATAGYLGLWQRGGRILVLCFSWSRKSDVPAKSKGEFHSVGFEKMLSQADVTLIGGSIEEMPHGI